MMSDTTPTPTTPSGAVPDRRALRILAKSVYRELKGSGYQRTDVVAFTNELLDLVAGEYRTGDDL